MTEPTTIPPEADFCGLIIPDDEPRPSTEDDVTTTEDDQ